MKGMKNSHAEAFVRPGVLFKALATLKTMGNPFYQNVLKKCLYCSFVFGDEDDIFAHDKECHQKFLEKEITAGSQDIEEIDENEDLADEEPGLKNVKTYQAINDVSCVVNNHPEVNIIVNNSDVPKKVNVKDSLTGKNVILAPGEGQIPSNIMRTKDYDTKGNWNYPNLKHIY